MPWFVLYTKSRCEKKVATNLQLRGIEVYCPLRKVVRKWSDRDKIVEEPLFRSYCFVRLEESEREKVFGVSGVVRFLFWLNKPAIVRDHEIQLIKNLLNEFDHETIEITSLVISDRVQIQSGVFINQTGYISQVKGHKIVISIDSLRVQITIDPRRNKVVKYAEEHT